MTGVVLGINAFHGDAAVAIVVDGEVRAAVEEERFRRIKHWAGFPTEGVGFCLREAGVKLRDVDAIAINSAPTANLARKLAFAARQRPQLSQLIDRVRNQSKRASVVDLLAEQYPTEEFRGQVIAVEHHIAHLASAFYCSPFERAIALSVDGFGDFASAAWGIGEGQRLRVDGRIYYPHSLGVFYQALTQYLGFPHYGDEYKVMGLAPYGCRRYVGVLERLVHIASSGEFALDLRYFRHHDSKVEYTWDGGEPRVGTLYSPALVELLGPARAPSEPLEARHHDIAASVQAIYEAALVALVRARARDSQCASLVLSGGCAMNSVANGKLRSQTPVTNLYVPPAAGDAGGAIGAALEAVRLLGGDARRGRLTQAYLGPGYSNAVVQCLLDREAERLDARGVRIELCRDSARLNCRTASAIADGKVIGWFQGRLEFGPRALGNRSILCDPRRTDMQALLNERIKRRESFRPFAPAVMVEHVAEWFEVGSDSLGEGVPFMSEVWTIQAAQRARVPAVTHVDGTGRLQTVAREDNPRFYDLIDTFRRQTGVPMLLNTSFNEQEPIVCTPAEALSCFLRTRMDVLVLGDYLLERPGAPAPA